MAKAIATITGTALAPGVSRNKRLYTREAIGKMVARASERIAAGNRPIAMYTSHDSVDVADIGGVITRIWQEADGSARYSADIPDTPTGRAVANLTDTRDGTQFLRGVSILGNWVGGPRHESAGGQTVETGSDFELGRLDFTSSPGVDGAGIDALQAAIGDGEALAQYGIAESAPEALVISITEETGTHMVGETGPELFVPSEAGHVVPNVPEGAREALAALFGAPEVSEGSLPGTVAMSKRKSGMSGSGRKYADPGYQADKKQRYDITDKAHAVAAWRYINQAKKAAKYSAAQLKNIKARIRAALKSFGVTAAAEGWVILDAYQVTEAVAEFYGDPSKAGSWSVTACNGPVSLSMSCYGMDPADLQACLSAAAGAAGTALAALDPDMDGDVDVPAGGSGDTDGDSGMGKGVGGAFGGEDADDAEAASETDSEDPATEDEPAAAGEDDAPASETSEAAEGPGDTPATGREPDKETEAPVTTEATTNPGGSAPSAITEADVQKAIAEALAKDRKDRKAAKKAARKAESAKQKPVGETAVTESQDEREKRLIAEALKAAGVQPAVQETEEERVNRLVKEGITGFVQEAISSGAVIPGRAGLQVRESATEPDEAKDIEALSKLSDEEFQAYGGANLDAYMGQNTRHQALHG